MTTPAMRVIVGNLFSVQQKPLFLQEINDQCICFKNMLAFPFRDVIGKKSAIIDRRDNRKRRVLFLTELKVFHPMSGSDMNEACPRIHRDKPCWKQFYYSVLNPRVLCSRSAQRRTLDSSDDLARI